jgi:hypothetical protein
LLTTALAGAVIAYVKGACPPTAVRVTLDVRVGHVTCVATNVMLVIGGSGLIVTGVFVKIHPFASLTVIV